MCKKHMLHVKLMTSLSQTLDCSKFLPLHYKVPNKLFPKTNLIRRGAYKVNKKHKENLMNQCRKGRPTPLV